MGRALGTRGHQISGDRRKNDRAVLQKRITTGGLTSAQPGAVCTAVLGSSSCFHDHIRQSGSVSLPRRGGQGGSGGLKKSRRFSLLRKHSPALPTLGWAELPCPPSCLPGSLHLQLASPCLRSPGSHQLAAPSSAHCWKRFLLTKSQVLPHTSQPPVLTPAHVLVPANGL